MPPGTVSRAAINRDGTPAAVFRGSGIHSRAHLRRGEPEIAEDLLQRRRVVRMALFAPRDRHKVVAQCGDGAAVPAVRPKRFRAIRIQARSAIPALEFTARERNRHSAGMSTRRYQRRDPRYAARSSRHTLGAGPPGRCHGCAECRHPCRDHGKAINAAVLHGVVRRECAVRRGGILIVQSVSIQRGCLNGSPRGADSPVRLAQRQAARGLEPWRAVARPVPDRPRIG